MGEKPKLLFLDDRSKRLHGALKKYGEQYDVTLVCTAKECIKMLSNEGPWDVVSLDHDLDFDEFVPSLLPGTGMEVVRWLCENYEMLEYVYMIPKFIILHSSNYISALQMWKRLKESGYTAEYERFTYDD